MRVINQSPKEKPVTIEFTPSECKVLAVICSLISGNTLGPRSVVEDLMRSLEEEGYHFTDLYDRDFDGNIHCPDGWDFMERKTK